MRDVFNRIADPSWIAPLTRGMPGDIDWEIKDFRDLMEYRGEAGFTLEGRWRGDGALVFDRSEYLDWDHGHSSSGRFKVTPPGDGHRGLGLLYMRNFMEFFGTEFGFTMMHILAAAESGARVWAEAGFTLDPAMDMAPLRKKLGASNRLVRNALTVDEQAKLSGYTTRILRGEPRAIWDMVDWDIDLAGPRRAALQPGSNSDKKMIAELLERHKGRLPLAATVLHNARWEGVFRIGDPEQTARLDAAIARKCRPQP